jgi:RNA recognition motif-containing protein
MSSGEEEDRSTRRETELEDGEEKPVSRVSEQTIDESKVQGVFVGNLSVEVKKREIEDLFIKFGNIARIGLWTLGDYVNAL